MTVLNAEPEEKIQVSKSALRQVLLALDGPGYMIRKLQVTRGLPLAGDVNPIDKLLKEFKERSVS